MLEATRTRLEAVVVAVAPLVLLASFLWHPYLPGRLPNEAAIAAAAATDTTRWGLAHLAAGIASGFLAVAFVSIRSYMREAGEDRWSGLGLPLIVMGSTVYAILPGMEFAPLAAAETGGNPEAAQAALAPWFLPVLLIGAATFGLGALGFARALAVSGVLSAGLTWAVVLALAVMAATRFVPFAVAQFYLQSAAAIVALWPLAYAMAKQTSVRPIGRSHPAPAT